VVAQRPVSVEVLVTVVMVDRTVSVRSVSPIVVTRRLRSGEGYQSADACNVVTCRRSHRQTRTCTGDTDG